MYISIEGTKGTGKSTLIKRIFDFYNNQGISIVLAQYTAPTTSLLDRILMKFPAITKKNDFIKEYAYAKRSNYVAKSIDWSKELILGDRCLVTSYATRLWRYKDVEEQIKRVDKLMPLIPAPDLIIYLEADIDTIRSRILKRERLYGKEDETEAKLLSDKKAYEFIKNNKNLFKRLNNTEWITIDSSQNIEVVLNLCIIQINKFLNKYGKS